MGAGKSTIGKALAKHLAWTFMDTDVLLEAATGVSIPTIFEIEGEASFRKRESALLSDLCIQNSTVLATGGGIVLSAENRTLLKQKGKGVYLSATAAELAQRTRGDKARPLLNHSNRLVTLRNILAVRDPLYHDVADCVLHTSGRSVSSTVQSICDFFQLEPDAQSHAE